MDDVAENRLLSRWATLLPVRPDRVAAVHEADAELVSLGDGRLLALTVDTVAEEIRAGLYRDPRTAGRIGVTASLSDLAAVGAAPLGVLVSVTLPHGDVEGTQTRLATGIREACAAAGTFVLGGDTSEGEGLDVTVAAAGLVPRAAVLTRIGARPGDDLWVSGPVGAGAALAASVLLDLPGLDEGAFAPPSRLALGRALGGVATACIDTSDGLLAAADQLARLNRVGVCLDAPLAACLHPAASALCGALGIGALPIVAAHHGEYELLFAAPPGARGEVEARAPGAGARPRRVGRVVGEPGLYVEGRPVDGAAVRNLLAACGGDLVAYVGRLVALEER